MVSTRTINAVTEGFISGFNFGSCLYIKGWDFYLIFDASTASKTCINRFLRSSSVEAIHLCKRVFYCSLKIKYMSRGYEFLLYKLHFIDYECDFQWSILINVVSSTSKPWMFVLATSPRVRQFLIVTLHLSAFTVYWRLVRFEFWVA